MRNVLRFILRYRLILLLLTFQFGGLALTYRDSPMHTSMYWSSVLENQAKWNATRDNWKGYFNLAESNQSLQKENTRLRQLLSQPGIRSLNAVDSNQFEWLSAEVIYSTSQLLNNVLILNRGSKDGIAVGQGVLSSEGVLGVVSQASPHFAKIISLLHSESRISGVTMRSGHFGTVVWHGGAANELEFEDIPLDAQMQIGDTVVTDARSAIFPEGWPIGWVIAVESDSSSYTQSATLKMWGGVSRQQAAYVVKNTLMDEQQSLLAP
ncbi:MAG: rod shape-determining protein MreC [Schleiferiaceae bacterium]|nr:rod shape-determining protein MreC [Schleiferiaceae bacterium]